jgi:hypothetical protein
MATSRIQAWSEARAALDAHDRLASLCDKGFSEHRKRKPPLRDRLSAVTEKIQPSPAFA